MTVIIGGTGTANGITSFSSSATFGGTLATASRGISNASIPAGGVIQVVTATTSTQVTVTSTTYTDTTLSATITPTSSSSKILILVNQQVSYYRSPGDWAGGGIKLVRNSTDILSPNADSTGPYENWVFTAGSTSQSILRHAISHVDSPATTSATTYKTQIRGYTAAVSCRVQGNDTNGNGVSTITLMEIAQ